jgi:hypothetical protein
MKNATVLALAAFPAFAFAQPTQVVKPPIALYWMSVETSAGMSMPGMGAMAGMMGGQGQGGRSMLLQLGSQNAVDAPRAEHDIPPGLAMGPMLPLVTPQARAESRERGGMPERMERPKGRMLIYWGCGESARPGQPVVLDFAKLAEGERPPVMGGRPIASPSAPAPGRNRTYGDWPNTEDTKRVPENATLRGEHMVKGNYSPEIRFGLGEGQDFMATVALAGAPRGAGAAGVSWNSVPTATGYFAMAIGSSGQEEFVLWSSSEVQEMGGALMDYLPPAEVARLVREKRVMPPSTTECAVPAEVVQKAGGTPMLNFIAYGPEANFAQPPRPSDPKIAWEPQWATKVRFKSTATLLLGEYTERAERRARPERAEKSAEPERQASPPPPAAPDPVKEGINVLKGIFGR